MEIRRLFKKVAQVTNLIQFVNPEEHCRLVAHGTTGKKLSKLIPIP